MLSNGGARPRIARNIAWSVGGSLLPLPVAVLVIRPLFVSLGAERFGVLALAWAAMGYFNLFDAGVGRATTNLIAAARAGARHERLGEILWSSIAAHAALGIAGGVLLAIAGPAVVDRALALSPAVAIETRQAVWLLALSVPLVVWSTLSRAVLEGFNRFDLVATGNVVTSVLVYLLPFAALAVSATLPAVIGAVLAARVIGLLVLAGYAARESRAARAWVPPSGAVVRAMVGQGGWMTVSTIVTPALSTIDRFILASVLSAAVVGFYSIPYDIITRLWLPVGAVLSVLFPVFSASTDDAVGGLRVLLTQSATLLVAGLAPVLAVLIAIAPAAFGWWLGADFAAVGAPIAQALAAGMLFSAIAHLCTTVLQAARQSRVVAILDAVQLALYVAAAWEAALRHGPIGVAVVWMIRAFVQACVALAACHASPSIARLMPSRTFWARLLGPALALCAIATAVSGLESRVIAAAIFATAVVAFAAGMWSALLDDGTRALVRGALQPSRDIPRGAGLG